MESVTHCWGTLQVTKRLVNFLFDDKKICEEAANYFLSESGEHGAAACGDLHRRLGEA